jgi:hypothetical protein
MGTDRRGSGLADLCRWQQTLKSPPVGVRLAGDGDLEYAIAGKPRSYRKVYFC